MYIPFIILGFFVVWIFEIIPLIRDKDMRKAICYSSLMLISLSVSLIVLLCNKETSIAAVIGKVMKSIAKSMKI